MSEEMVRKDLAVQDVHIMAERLAFLHYAFAKTLEEEFSPEEARRLTAKAIEAYGSLAAASATQRIEAADLPTTMANFRHGKDLPSMGWQMAPAEMPPDKPFGKATAVHFCPLAETWKQLGPDAVRLGRLYCWVDQEKYKAYGKGYRCTHDKNTLDGDDCCVIRVELDGPDDE